MVQRPGLGVSISEHDNNVQPRNEAWNYCRTGIPSSSIWGGIPSGDRAWTRYLGGNSSGCVEVNLRKQMGRMVISAVNDKDFDVEVD